MANPEETVKPERPTRVLVYQHGIIVVDVEVEDEYAARYATEQYIAPGNAIVIRPGAYYPENNRSIVSFDGEDFRESISGTPEAIADWEKYAGTTGDPPLRVMNRDEKTWYRIPNDARIARIWVAPDGTAVIWEGPPPHGSRYTLKIRDGLADLTLPGSYGVDDAQRITHRLRVAVSEGEDVFTAAKRIGLADASTRASDRCSKRRRSLTSLPPQAGSRTFSKPRSNPRWLDPLTNARVKRRCGCRPSGSNSK